ncbi:MAG: 2-amino-4-hydroxy-6-hydroxymethyldihydropteridine diphosphokinase [Azoarcus sp.]|jgi:2-amino-4-hydroxy-6-hydroxymethyldihydropteridine diphosphokinase|nr:2-amino-4-hydroxy-6-hydroxymethyldihydropteridine diphosphokinase [Azoarcus sp.]
MNPEPQRTRAYIGFGANLGNPFAILPSVLKTLAALPETRLAACSSYYRSAPQGVIGQQPDYINAVIALDTGLSPQTLLDKLLAIESAFGRRRTAALAPRPLDLDLLLHGETVMQSPALTLPHPRMHERAFVLLPLTEIAPALTLPGHGALPALLKKVAGQRIVRVRDIQPPMSACDVKFG